MYRLANWNTTQVYSMTWVSFFVDQTTSTWYKCVFVQRRSWRDGIDYGYIGVVCSRYVSMRVELLRRVVLLFANIAGFCNTAEYSKCVV